MSTPEPTFAEALALTGAIEQLANALFHAPAGPALDQAPGWPALDPATAAPPVTAHPGTMGGAPPSPPALPGTMGGASSSFPSPPVVLTVPEGLETSLVP